MREKRSWEYVLIRQWKYKWNFRKQQFLNWIDNKNN
jgi:hypothetical protein